MEPSTCNTPRLTLVSPVYVLAPDRISVPEPIFVSDPAKAAIQNHTGKSGAQVVGAYRQIVGSQNNRSTFITRERTDRHPWSVMTANVENAKYKHRDRLAKKLNLRRATPRSAEKGNVTPAHERLPALEES